MVTFKKANPSGGGCLVPRADSRQVLQAGKAVGRAARRQTSVKPRIQNEFVIGISKMGHVANYAVFHWPPNGFGTL